MGREQLLAQQRARVLAMRARKLAEKQAKLKKEADIKKYGSGTKKGVSRDISKDTKKTVTTTPAAKPKAAGKKPVQKESTVSKVSKVQETSKVQKAVKAVKAAAPKPAKRKGKAITLKMKDHPGLNRKSFKEQSKSTQKKFKLGQQKTFNGEKFYWDGSKWVRGKLGKTTRFKR